MRRGNAQKSTISSVNLCTVALWVNYMSTALVAEYLFTFGVNWMCPSTALRPLHNGQKTVTLKLA